MPVYDVENRAAYFQSYSDNIMSGSSTVAVGALAWGRGVVGSVVSGSSEWTGSVLLTDYQYEKSNPFFRSGEPRYVRLASSKQFVEDSIMPDILGLYLTGAWGSGALMHPGAIDGAHFIAYEPSDTFGFVPRLMIATDGRAIQTEYAGEVVHTRVNNTEWYSSFPFEKKYAGVKIPNPDWSRLVTHVTEIGTIAGAYFEFTTASLAVDVPREDAQIVLTTSGSGIFSCSVYVERPGHVNGSGNFIENSFHDPWGTTGTLGNLSLAARVMFGIKPKPLSVTNSVSFTNACYLACTGSAIQGWKYGLFNGVPTKFSCVFRQNHFGQPMDMLEGRPYTMTYKNAAVGGPLDTNGGINFISGSALSGESNNYLTASIYKSNNVSASYVVNPYCSGLFDGLYRSGMPWSDCDPRVGT